MKQAEYLNLLAKDIGATIRKLKKDFPSSSNIYKRTILLKGEWNDLQKKINAGIISTEDRIIQQNKLRAQVMEVIQLIGREDLPELSSKPSRLGLWLVLAALVLGLSGWFVWKQLNPEPDPALGQPIAPTTQKVDSVRVGNVLFYIPRVMQIGRKHECTVRIANKKVPDNSLKENIAKTRLANTKKEETPIGNIMEVEILPMEKERFKLEYATNVQQPILEHTYTEWTIYVTPLANINVPDTYKLNLQVSIIGKDKETDFVTKWDKWIAKDIEIKVITEQPAEPYPKPWDTAATVVLASHNFADSLTVAGLSEQENDPKNPIDPSNENQNSGKGDNTSKKPTTNTSTNTNTNTSSNNSNTDSKSGVVSYKASGKPAFGSPLLLRGIIKKPKPISYSGPATGKIAIKVCIDKKGKVISAEYTSFGSTFNDTKLRKLAINNAKQWVFKEAKVIKIVKKTCGRIIYDFKGR